MITTYDVNNMQDLVKAVILATQHFNNDMLWWRGQANAQWGVQPSLYRTGKAIHEANMTLRFVNQARVRHAQVPSENDIPGWLFLMQHYGLPTRLLDWTQSPMIGLFFALREEEYDGKDGGLWGLQPSRLNMAQVEKKLILGSKNSLVSPLFQAAYELGKDPEAGKTLAIMAQHIDIRQMVQASEFTIHGSDTPLDQIPEADQFLVRIRIPQEAKSTMRKCLDVFNVSESYLFPDLEHLSKELAKCDFSEE